MMTGQRFGGGGAAGEGRQPSGSQVVFLVEREADAQYPDHYFSFG